MPGKVWTAKDRELVRRHYGRRAPEPVPAAELAARLGTTVDRLRQAAHRFGVRAHSAPRYFAEYAGRVQGLHQRGWSDQHIARHLGVPAATVWRWRRRLGLPPNGYADPHYSRGQAATLRRTARRHGLASTADLGNDRFKVEAARRGWPQARCPSEADFLDALGSGPKTARQLADAAGLSLVWAHHLLARMRRDGLVVVTNPSRRPALYVLAEGVCRHRPEVRAGGAVGPRAVREPTPLRVAM